MKSLEVNYFWYFQSYDDNMKDIFNKIPIAVPVKTSQCFKEKSQLILTEIRFKWYMENLNTKLMTF